MQVLQDPWVIPVCIPAWGAVIWTIEDTWGTTVSLLQYLLNYNELTKMELWAHTCAVPLSGTYWHLCSGRYTILRVGALTRATAAPTPAPLQVILHSPQGSPSEPCNHGSVDQLQKHHLEAMRNAESQAWPYAYWIRVSRLTSSSGGSNVSAEILQWLSVTPGGNLEGQVICPALLSHWVSESPCSPCSTHAGLPSAPRARQAHPRLGGLELAARSDPRPPGLHVAGPSAPLSPPESGLV